MCAAFTDEDIADSTGDSAYGTGEADRENWIQNTSE